MRGRQQILIPALICGATFLSGNSLGISKELSIQPLRFPSTSEVDVASQKETMIVPGNTKGGNTPSLKQSTACLANMAGEYSQRVPTHDAEILHNNMEIAKKMWM